MNLVSNNNLNLSCWSAPFQTNDIPLSEYIKNYKQPPYLNKTLRGNKLKEYLAQFDCIPFTQLQKNALVGTLLGDGNLECRSNNVRFTFSQGRGRERNKNWDFSGMVKSIRKEYVYLLYTIFVDYVGSSPQIYIHNGNPLYFWFHTFGIKKLNYYMDQFYVKDSPKKGKFTKIVPKNIELMLNAEVLSFWFCDDGSKTPYGYKLSTDGFNELDVIRLQQALENVFGLKVNLGSSFNKKTKKTYYRLFILASSRDDFTRLVEPNMIETMKYKLHPIR